MARTSTAPLKTARWAAVRAFVAHRASFRCEHCNVFLGMAGDVDHVVPRSAINACGIGVFDPSTASTFASPATAPRPMRNATRAARSGRVCPAEPP